MRGHGSVRRKNFSYNEKGRRMILGSESGKGSMSDEHREKKLNE